MKKMKALVLVAGKPPPPPPSSAALLRNDMVLVRMVILAIQEEMIQILLVQADPLPFLRERHRRHLGGVAHLLVDDSQQARGQT